MSKYWIDAEGRFNMVTADDVTELEGCTEVPSLPEDSRQRWSGEDWLPLAPNYTLIEQIEALEAMITPRRLREAVLGTEEQPNWLAEQEEAIAVLRGQL